MKGHMEKDGFHPHTKYKSKSRNKRLDYSDPELIEAMGVKIEKQNIIRKARTENLPLKKLPFADNLKTQPVKRKVFNSKMLKVEISFPDPKSFKKGDYVYDRQFGQVGVIKGKARGGGNALAVQIVGSETGISPMFLVKLKNEKQSDLFRLLRSAERTESLSEMFDLTDEIKKITGIDPEEGSALSKSDPSGRFSNLLRRNIDDIRKREIGVGAFSKEELDLLHSIPFEELQKEGLA